MAEALAAAFTDNLLTCSICLGEYEDPRVLPCYHTFCYGCICDHFKRTSSPNRTFLCPVCREKIQFPAGGLSHLKKNFVFSKAKDIITQQQAYTGTLDSEQTNVAAVTQANAEMTISCEKHPDNKLKYYCEEDDTIVCGDCASTDHYRHGIVPVEKLANANRNKVKTALVKILPKLNMFKDAVAKETATEREESRLMTASIKKIKEQAKRIRRLVDQREQKLISEVTSAGYIRQKQKEANKDARELHHASLHSACNFAQELITNGSDSDIMIHSKALTERLTAMEKIPVATLDISAKISYTPGKISAAGLEVMLGQVTVQSQPPRTCRLEENLPNPRSAPHPPIFLEKAKCVNNFCPRLKDNKIMYITGLAIDEQHMYIVDRASEKTGVFTHKGQFKFDFKVNSLFDVTVSQTGHLYITSRGDKCVHVYSTRGQHLTTMGCGRLEMLSGVTLNRQGHVMVCDGSNKSIFTFHPYSGQLLNTIPLSMCEDPIYITVNSLNDNIVISDWGSNSVHILSPTGNQLYQYGTYGSGDGQLGYPHGVCTDSYGHIFIAAYYNHKIVALSPQGQFITNIATEDDGLLCPMTVAINPAGQLVVTDEAGKVMTFQYLR
ncbi:tripartite motif-containing protein 3-like [Lingula anatina]|uniref:Tripartite motif-containing protein 3-like n=1 Tax=Lingula anatina TaxID=7574 RepID=A0A1S3K7L7_LINAN|nr:tripartite motif-containing protein 3-like [Lingula anatina]|eukprot:XP_013418625.1 tripartite motif-containing protein 3-like [Lingula anatina]